MLREVFSFQTRRRDFLNVSTGERIRVDLLELRHHFVFGRTSGGLILLCQKGTGAVRLLNPLTGQLTALPNATSLQNDSRWRSRTRLSKLMEAQAFSAGLVDSSTLALHFYDKELHHYDYEVAVAKPNVERWTRCRFEQFIFFAYSTLSFENRLYCFTEKGIMVVDITGAGQGPQLVVAVKVDKDFFGPYNHWYLVDNDGQLILVRRNHGLNYPKSYMVYLVDLDVGKMVPVLGLRGRALFLRHDGCALSVHAGLSSSISANTVYECRERGEGADRRPRIGAYDLSQEEWIIQDFYPHQGSILDYLSRYVCRSKDITVGAVGAGTSRKQA
jgi:hypothetical protein